MGIFDAITGRSDINEIKAEVLGNNEFSAKMKSSNDMQGTIPTATLAQMWGINDRSIKCTISRDAAGCEWAYYNDGTVSNTVNQVMTLVVNGMIVKVAEEFKEEDVKGAIALLENKKPLVKEKVENTVQNKMIHGKAFFKLTRKGEDITNIVTLAPEECVAIVDHNSGELGGKVGLGINQEDPLMEVALVQNGHIFQYDYTGAKSENIKYFYFPKEDIIYFTVNDRGKFDGVSPVRRILRYVEIKKSLENIVELIVRRFGPQIVVTMGNKDINLMNTKIPQAYLRDSTGKPIDQTTARNAYRTALFASAETAISDFADSDRLVQLLEYGNSISTMNPTASAFAYNVYINEFSNSIKMGMISLYMHGRVDITSAVMQEKVTKDLKDIVSVEREKIIAVFNEKYVKQILKANGFNENCVYYGFKPVDKEEEDKETMIEFRKSQTILNYINAGFKDIPEYLKEKWDITTEGNMNPNALLNGQNTGIGKIPTDHSQDSQQESALNK